MEETGDGAKKAVSGGGDPDPVPVFVSAAEPPRRNAGEIYSDDMIPAFFDIRPQPKDRHI